MNSFHKPLQALFLSTVIPGLGHIRAGYYRKGLLWCLLVVVLPLALVFLGIHGSFGGLIALLVLTLGLYGWNIADAFVQTRRAQGQPARPLTATLWTLLLLFFAMSGYTMAYQAEPMALPLRSFYAASTSMIPTLQRGDYMVVDLAYYRHHPLTHNSVVMLQHRDYHYPLTKRVIALAGDTIEGRDAILYRNGQALQEPYVQQMPTEDTTICQTDCVNRSFAQRVVPPGKVFVVGDNRLHSRDSRDQPFGYIDEQDIIGKPLYIYWSAECQRIGTTIR